MSERGNWLNKKQVEDLVKGLLNPEIESMRTGMVQIANEARIDQVSNFFILDKNVTQCICQENKTVTTIGSSQMIMMQLTFAIEM